MGALRMDKLYEFLTGPALLAAFAILIVGLIVRVTYLYALSKAPENASHNHVDLKGALRVIFHWPAPPGSSVGLRVQPVFATASFVFLICLVGVPLFVLAHNTLWEEAFNFGLPSLPDSFTDAFTVVFLMSGVLLLAERMVRAKVGSLSTARDYSLLLLSSAPFVTGFLAHRQIGPYKLTLILHIIFAEILLIVIPFSIGHLVLFLRGK
jgi:nitrate reductase gamma subunit